MISDNVVEISFFLLAGGFCLSGEFHYLLALPTGVLDVWGLEDGGTEGESVMFQWLHLQ